MFVLKESQEWFEVDWIEVLLPSIYHCRVGTQQRSRIPVGCSLARLGGMFSGAIAFNQPLDRWDVRNVYDTERMFEGATAFQQQTSLRTWGSKKSFPGDRRVTQSYQQNHLVEERR